MEEGQPHLGLSELLDQDFSSYEFYYSLPTAVREQIQKARSRLFFRATASGGKRPAKNV